MSALPVDDAVGDEVIEAVRDRARGHRLVLIVVGDDPGFGLDVDEAGEGRLRPEPASRAEVRHGSVESCCELLGELGVIGVDRRPRVVRVDDQEPTTRAQHAMQLPHGGLRVVEVDEDAFVVRGVEGAVVKGQGREIADAVLDVGVALGADS